MPLVTDRTVQERLTAKGLYGGKIDGDVGPVTIAALMRLAAGASAKNPRPLIHPLSIAIDAQRAVFDITTPLRLCHFLAQGAHETDSFKTMIEYGGTEYFKRYDGRADLGNTKPGDGYRFRGRGFIQCTGRANYATYGKMADLDLIADPDLAAEPTKSVLIAMAYWKDRDINPAADANNIVLVTKRVNGGSNGIAHRRECFGRLAEVWGIE